MVVVVPGADALAPSLTDAFSDLLDLRTAVIENVNRPDIADVFPRIVALAESRFDRQLRTREQIEVQTVTFSGGVATLPTNVVEVISLTNASGAEYLQQSPQLGTANRNVGVYSIQGGSIVGPVTEGDLQLMFYAKIPRLVSLADTNWLLSQYPSVYLYGASFEAAKHIRDVDLAQINQTLLNEAIEDVRTDDTRARYSRARVRVSGATP